MKRRFILMFVTIIFTLMAVNVSAATTITSNTTGKLDDFDYELWKDYGDTTSMTLNGGGTFSCAWGNDVNNVLFKMGKKYNSKQTWHSIGDIIIEYACNYQPNGNSYLAVYGWNTDPLIEYYIIDSWGTWKPPGISAKGAVTIDGGVYDIYQNTRYNMPSINGPATFQQYYSVRREKRTSGIIHVSEHFRAWESMGMKAGDLYEVSLLVEGYQSNGTAEVTKMKYDVIELPKDTEVPTSPAELKSTYITNSTVNLAWTESTDNVVVTGYNIYNGSELVGTSKTNKCTLSGLTENTPYRLTVKAKDAFGNLSDASNELNVTTLYNFKSGDINKDGAINALDLAHLRAYLVGIKTTLDSLEAADTNADGSIDALDLSLLKRFLLGTIDSLPS